MSTKFTVYARLTILISSSELTSSPCSAPWPFLPAFLDWALGKLKILTYFHPIQSEIVLGINVCFSFDTIYDEAKLA